MGRTLLCSFAGAGLGFFSAFVIVLTMSRGSPGSDFAAVFLFVGTFLAGSGAIAGAVVGGVAEFVKRSDRMRPMHGRGASESDA